MLKSIEQQIRKWRYLLQRKFYRFFPQQLKHRREIPFLLNSLKIFGVGVEIGVKEGKFSEEVLLKWKGLKLISIDPWLTEDSSRYVDKANVSQDLHNNFYRETLERLKPFGDRSEVLRKTSLEGASCFLDYHLDFCYIDARHDYSSVLEDLKVWYPKVKIGGVISGHDYVDGMIDGSEFGVKKAVNEFFNSKKQRVYFTCERDFPSWFVIKE